MRNNKTGLMTFADKRVYLRCINCGTRFEADPLLTLCPKCKGLLEIIVKPIEISRRSLRGKGVGVWGYKRLLPVPRGVKPISLSEGWTPLIRSEKLEELLGIKRVYVKFEGANPTGSFKDRGMTIAVSLAWSIGIRDYVVASTGNTAASAAAYVSKAGGKCWVLLPRGGVAKGKLAQVFLHGARLVEVEGVFDDALRVALESSKILYPLNSFNPWRLEGQKTLAFEIVEQLGFETPNWVVVPVGNAGNISAIWKGFKELFENDLILSTPHMAGIQAEKASPIATAWKKRLDKPLFTDKPETIASAIRIGKPINWPKAWRAVDESGGMFETVSDPEILEAQKLLARSTGIAVEPASAASLAGLIKLRSTGDIDSSDTVVIIATGHGLKDTDTIISTHSKNYEYLYRVKNPKEFIKILEEERIIEKIYSDKTRES